jgi:glycosyltransferase involved in cell wall biosynthesis
MAMTQFVPLPLIGRFAVWEDGMSAGRKLNLLSVVTPMYFEEETAREFYARTVATLADVPFELVIVDDGSTDGTPEILAEIAAADPRVKVLTLSRNFGHQAALTAGLEHAVGDAILMIDADLQDPPELAHEMLEHWSDGADVVYAVRQERAGETKAKLATARWFYSLFSKLAQVKLEHNSGDFRLMDRRALDAMLAMHERNRFLRGMSVWIGFKQTAVAYARDPRFAGETKYTWKKMLRFSFDAIASFSHMPLQMATMLGFVCAGLAFAMIPLVILARVYDQFALGVPSVLVVTLLLGGIQLICTGIIGEYLGRVYDEVKGRPLYVVSGRQNLTLTPAATVADAPARTPLPVIADQGQVATLAEG